MQIGKASGDCRAALASRLPSTCAIRSRSAITRGSSGGRSIVTAWRPPPDRNAARALDQRGHVRRLGRDRQGARVDAPGVEEVGDRTDHPVGLLVDDPEEEERLCQREVAHPAEHRGGRTFGGSERGAEFVAHHAEEFGAHPVELLQRR